MPFVLNFAVTVSSDFFIKIAASKRVSSAAVVTIIVVRLQPEWSCLEGTGSDWYYSQNGDYNQCVTPIEVIVYGVDRNQNGRPVI